jgi:RNA polymerase sigma-70 factor (ECF subfamily)
MSFDVEEMYKRYGPMVFRRCRALLYNEDAALDAMQEVFVNLVRFSPRLNNRAPSSLLYTMATNHCLNVLAARKRLPVLPEEGFFDSVPGKDRFVDSVHARDTLEGIFSLHDERTRTIAWLHYVDGLTLEETAKEVGMSVSGIRKRLRNLQASSALVGDINNE